MQPGRLCSCQLQQQKHLRAFQGSFRTQTDRNKDPGIQTRDVDADRAEQRQGGGRAGTTQLKKGTEEQDGSVSTHRNNPLRTVHVPGAKTEPLFPKCTGMAL